MTQQQLGGWRQDMRQQWASTRQIKAVLSTRQIKAVLLLS
jgi:hypothetical protein